VTSQGAEAKTPQFTRWQRFRMWLPWRVTALALARDFGGAGPYIQNTIGIVVGVLILHYVIPLSSEALWHSGGDGLP